MISKSEPKWIDHDNGPCPVDGGTTVDVKFRDGFVSLGNLAGWWDDEDRTRSNWHHRPDDNDIIAYHVVQS